MKVEVECLIAAEDKDKSGGGWFNRAFVTRIDPIIVEITFEEMAGGTASIQSQFRNAKTSFSSAKEGSMYWLHVDDIVLWDRVHVSVMPPSRTEDLFEIQVANQMWYVDFNRLLVWGYQAFKANSPIYKLDKYSTEKVHTHVLVDLEKKLVWGFLFKLKSNENTNEGVWSIPEDLMEKGWRSVKEAIEPDALKNVEASRIPAPTATQVPTPVYKPSPAPATSTSTSTPTPTTTTTTTTTTPSATPAPTGTATATPGSPAFSRAAPSKPAGVSSPGPSRADKVRAFKCAKCSFGPSKEDCVKCGTKPFPGKAQPALLCQSCNVSHGSKCGKCGGMEPIADKRVPANLCQKCALPPAEKNCIKCGRLA